MTPAAARISAVACAQLLAQARCRAPRRARRAASGRAAVPAPGRARPAAAARRKARAAGGRPFAGRARRGRAAPSARASGSPRPIPKRMLSSTLRCGKSAPSCITRPMLRRCGGTAARASATSTAVELDHAGIGRLEAGDQPQQRRLAGARRADDRGARTRRGVEVDAGQRRDAAEALAETAQPQRASSADRPERLPVEDDAERQRQQDHRQRIGCGADMVELGGARPELGGQRAWCRAGSASASR